MSQLLKFEVVSMKTTELMKNKVMTQHQKLLEQTVIKKKKDPKIFLKIKQVRNKCCGVRVAKKSKAILKAPVLLPFGHTLEIKGKRMSTLLGMKTDIIKLLGSQNATSHPGLPTSTFEGLFHQHNGIGQERERCKKKKKKDYERHYWDDGS